MIAFLARDYSTAEKAFRKKRNDVERVWLAATLIARRKPRAVTRLLGKVEGPHVELLKARAAIETGRARRVKDALEPLRANPRYAAQAEVLMGKAMRKIGRREAEVG